MPGSASAVTSLPEVGRAAGNAVAIGFGLRQLALGLVRLVQVIFQNAGNGAQRGRGAVRQSFAAGCLQPLFAVPLFQFGQTSAGLVALLGGLTGLAPKLC